MGYSEALEQQVKLLRLWNSERGQAYADWLANFRSGQLSDIHGRVNANNIGTIIGYGLEGETFYWSPSVTDVVATTSQDIPDYVLTPDMLPARNGFFWFSGGVKLPRDTPGERSLCALSWTTMAQSTPTDSDIPDGILFKDLSDEDMASRKKVFAIVFYISGKISSIPDPMTICMWRESWSLRSTIQDMEVVLGSREDDRRIPKLQLFAGCLAFLQQRILLAPRQRAERHAVKRLEREGWTQEPLIRVVELRRKTHPSPPSEERAQVEWSHQWVVGGHWHNYWVGPCDTRILQPRWLMPYIKGPDAKPLKPPGQKVFAVIR